MTALYIILAVVAVIMLLLLIPADCILEFSYNNKENNGLYYKVCVFEI